MHSYIGVPYSLWDVHYRLGGPSYILNQSALQRVVEEGLPYFFKDRQTLAEDCVMGALMPVLHIHMVDTTDAAEFHRFFNDPLTT
jgi:hypothetical protein